MDALPPDAKLIRFQPERRVVVWRPIVPRIRSTIVSLLIAIPTFGGPFVLDRLPVWFGTFLFLALFTIACIESAFRKERELAEKGTASLAKVREITVRMKGHEIVTVPNRLEYSFTDEYGERYTKQTDNLTFAQMELLAKDGHAVILTLPGWEEKLWPLFRFVDILDVNPDTSPD